MEFTPPSSFLPLVMSQLIWINRESLLNLCLSTVCHECQLIYFSFVFQKIRFHCLQANTFDGVVFDGHSDYSDSQCLSPSLVHPTMNWKLHLLQNLELLICYNGERKIQVHKFMQTMTSDHHDELIKLGIDPSLKETQVTHKFPYVIFCAPPSRSPDYPGEVRFG